MRCVLLCCAVLCCAVMAVQRAPPSPHHVSLVLCTEEHPPRPPVQLVPIGACPSNCNREHQHTASSYPKLPHNEGAYRAYSFYFLLLFLLLILFLSFTTILYFLFHCSAYPSVSGQVCQDIPVGVYTTLHMSVKCLISTCSITTSTTGSTGRVPLSKLNVQLLY